MDLTAPNVEKPGPIFIARNEGRVRAAGARAAVGACARTLLRVGGCIRHAVRRFDFLKAMVFKGVLARHERRSRPGSQYFYDVTFDRCFGQLATGGRDDAVQSTKQGLVCTHTGRRLPASTHAPKTVVFVPPLPERLRQGLRRDKTPLTKPLKFWEVFVTMGHDGV